MTVTTALSHQELVENFFAQKRIAVCGLSRTKDSGAGAIYLKLRNHGYQVFPVHPTAETLHGDPCYANLGAIPDGVDAVFIMNSPDITEKIVDEAADLGIKRVWMHHNGMAPSSVSQAALDRCRSANIDVISVGCPMMFLEPDIFHSCVRWILRATRRMK